MTAERHARVRNSPTYRPELDFVVIAPDGEFAAFALVWLDEANRLGVFEPLGVAAAYQRRGLGRAIMAEGLRRLAEAGACAACVETGIGHDPARRLYEAAGFTLLDVNHAWTCPFPAPSQT
jgi:ribosomal protein S18 acetylase RimI-like enzyme